MQTEHFMYTLHGKKKDSNMIKLGLSQSSNIFLLWHWPALQDLPLTKLTSHDSQQHFTWDWCKPFSFYFLDFTNVQQCILAYSCTKEQKIPKRPVFFLSIWLGGGAWSNSRQSHRYEETTHLRNHAGKLKCYPSFLHRKSVKMYFYVL